MMIDDIRYVDTSHGSLPEGWVVADNQFELDETWMASAIRGQRQGEINQRELNESQREQIIEAKKKELQSHFKNAAWEFGDDSKGSLPHDRVVTARHGNLHNLVLMFQVPKHDLSSEDIRILTS